MGESVTLSTDLWQQNAELATAALGHPFVRGLAGGSLATAQFAAFIAQDAYFLEAFARAYAKFSQLRDRDRFRAWLVRMTWRLALDRRRADTRRLARETTIAAEAAPHTAEDEAIAAERAARLWDAIDALPEKLRITIVLSAIEGYDVREVARVLGLPEGTVKSRLFLARKGLAESLQCLTNDISNP